VTRASRLPAGLGDFSDNPAIKIRFEEAPDDEAAARLVCVLSELPHAMIVVSHERSFREAVTEYTLRLRDGRIETV